jgi:transposase
MAVAIQAKQYLDRAAAGEVLTADERRHAVLFVQGQNSGVTQRELSAMFGVSESQIRKDIAKNKESLTEEAKANYMETAVQDLIHEQNNVYEGVMQSLRQAPLGSRVRLDHEMARLKIRHDTVRLLQDIGVLPKSLGEVGKNKEVFKSELQPNTNQVVTRPVELFDGFEEGESLQDKLRREGNVKILEKEFAESYTLPTPIEINGQNSNEKEPDQKPA